MRALLLLAAGTAGGLPFTGVYLAEGATGAGYRTLAQPISALSLGLGLVMEGSLPRILPAGTRLVLAPGGRRYVGRCTPCSR